MMHFIIIDNSIVKKQQWLKCQNFNNVLFFKNNHPWINPFSRKKKTWMMACRHGSLQKIHLPQNLWTQSFENSTGRPKKMAAGKIRNFRGEVWPSLKLTAKAPNNRWLEYGIVSFFEMAYFQVLETVSFRECKLQGANRTANWFFDWTSICGDFEALTVGSCHHLVSFPKTMGVPVCQKIEFFRF